MKCLTLYLHAAAAEDAMNCLRSRPEVSGFTVMRCEGHSTRSEANVELATRDRVVGFVPRVRIEVVLEAAAVTAVLANLEMCLQGAFSQGIWTLTPLDGFGRIGQSGS
ncbi:MAG: DUF3240 family protein [Planctomycetota bacterium]